MKLTTDPSNANLAGEKQELQPQPVLGNIPAAEDAVQDDVHLHGLNNGAAAKMHTPVIVSETGRVSFPIKLHQILSDTQTDLSMISWLSHGKAWKVHSADRFEEEIIPRYFELTKFSSFTRQVNGWGFRRITRGADKGGFYHEHFIRGHPELCAKMRRLKKRDGIDPFYALRAGGAVAVNAAASPNALLNGLTGASPASLNMQAMNAMQMNAAAMMNMNAAAMANPHAFALSQAAMAAHLQQHPYLANMNAAGMMMGLMPPPASTLLAASTGAAAATAGLTKEGEAAATAASAATAVDVDPLATSTPAETPATATATTAVEDATADGKSVVAGAIPATTAQTNVNGNSDINAMLQAERLRLQQAAFTAQRNAAALQLQADLLLAQMQARTASGTTEDAAVASVVAAASAMMKTEDQEEAVNSNFSNTLNSNIVSGNDDGKNQDTGEPTKNVEVKSDEVEEGNTGIVEHGPAVDANMEESGSV